MAKIVCCIHDTQIGDKGIIAVLSVSLEGGIVFSTDMLLDFQKSVVQLNNDLKSKVAFLATSSFGVPSVSGDVILCGAFS